MTFSVNNKIILAFYLKYINIKPRLSKKIYNIKTLTFLFITILANSFLLRILIH